LIHNFDGENKSVPPKTEGHRLCRVFDCSLCLDFFVTHPTLGHKRNHNQGDKEPDKTKAHTLPGWPKE
jgi:hypothetical protein